MRQQIFMVPIFSQISKFRKISNSITIIGAKLTQHTFYVNFANLAMYSPYILSGWTKYTTTKILLV